MWGRLAALAILAAGCSFTPGNAASGGGGGDAGQGDARRDGSMPPGDGSGSPPDAAVDAPIDAPMYTCPSDYNLHDNARPFSYYRMVTASTDWANAENDCEDDANSTTEAAHLIVLDDFTELAWAWSTNNSQQWIGVSDRVVENVFADVTDQLLYYPGTLGGNAGNKDCAMIFNSTDTSVDGCNSGHPYLCECDGYRANSLKF